jgi:hypothetical protein
LIRTSKLRLANEIVRVNHTSYAVFVALTGVLSDYASLALHHYILVAAGQFWWQRNFKFNTGSNFKRWIAADVHTRRAHVSSNTSLVHALDLDG